MVTPPVVTKWGGEMTLEKVNENGTALAGASFSVYTNEADALAGTNPVALNGQSVFTVAADGTLTISGLRYSDWQMAQLLHRARLTTAPTTWSRPPPPPQDTNCSPSRFPS